MARREDRGHRPYGGLRTGDWERDEWVQRGGVYTPTTEGTWRRPEDALRDRFADSGELRNVGGIDDERRGRSEWGPHMGVGPKGWSRSADAIRDEVGHRMWEDDRLDARDIEVTVDDGEVTLAGTVENRMQKRLAERIADGVRGVRDVHNRLTLRGRTAERDPSRRTTPA